MYRKLLAILILSAMFMHCAGRLGGLAYLYAKRYEIAQSLGIATEKAIAICSGKYHPGDTVVIVTSDNTSVVPDFMQAQEIHLFCVGVYEPSQHSASSEKAFGSHQDTYRLEISSSIFHPPLG